jgi:hypothetical protein
VRADVHELARKMARKMHRRGASEERVPRRAVTDKGLERNGVAAASDPRQLELGLDGRVDRPTGGAVDEDRDPAERARAIVDSLDQLSSEEVFAAFEALDALPPAVVRAALAVATGPAPDPELLDDATRRAHGFPPRPLRLRTLAVVKDADIFDLGSVAGEQLRIAGKAWDGRDLEPEERLDGEIEGSFAGTLEHHAFADADSSSEVPLFDVLLYAGGAGSIFRAGTTDLIGAIADTTVEMKDRRARVAIREALATPLAAAIEKADVVAEAIEEAEVEAVDETPPSVVELSSSGDRSGVDPSSDDATSELAPKPKKATAGAKKATAERAAAKVKKATAEKAAAKVKKATAEKTPEKTAEKIAAKGKKTTAEKTAAKGKRTTAEKAAAKGKRTTAVATTTAEKPAAKKTAAKKAAKKVATEE